MRKKTVAFPSPLAPAAPIGEVNAVLTALEKLNPEQQVIVLRSVVAFFDIASGDLNANPR